MNAKYILAWLPMVLIGIVNGILREILILEPLGDDLAHQVSTVTLFVLLGFYIWYIVQKIGIHSVRESWLAGSIWILLTIFFEFGLGYFSGQSIPELLSAYNIFEGWLWAIIPIWVGIAPRIIFSISNRSDDRSG